MKSTELGPGRVSLLCLCDEMHNFYWLDRGSCASVVRVRERHKCALVERGNTILVRAFHSAKLSGDSCIIKLSD